MAAINKARIVAEAERTLGPYIGGAMARAAVIGHFEKLGFRGSSVAEHEIQAMIEAIRPGLSVFVGREKAGRVVEEFREALNRAGGQK